MPKCMFNKGFSTEGCDVESEDFDVLLAHVREEHSATAWTMATLVMALQEIEVKGR